MRISLLPVSVALLLAAVSVLPLAGAELQPAPKKEKVKTLPAVTAQQEAEVMQFLRQHHTELAELLTHLQTHRPADYNRAVRDLWHARERLRQFEKGDSQRLFGELENGVLLRAINKSHHKRSSKAVRDPHARAGMSSTRWLLRGHTARVRRRGMPRRR